MASDGLTRLVTADEILNGLRRGDIDMAADDLLGLALSRGAPDNVSLVLVRPLTGASAS